MGRTKHSMGNLMIIQEDVGRIVQNVDLTELKGKRILITGATGLFGTYFIHTLMLAANMGIVPGELEVIHRNVLPPYLEEILEKRWIKIVQGDLSDNVFVSTIGNFDYILHFAGYGQPAMFMANQIKTIKLNTGVTMELLDRLNAQGKFLYASSSAIYNGLQKDAFTENDAGTTNTMHPRACYIEGKRCGEAIVNAYRAGGVDACAARISYTYGPGVRETDERALYSFIKQGMKGKIELLDRGEAGRIYCYISDAVELLWKILLFGKSPIYNIGGEEQTSILGIANIIGEMLNAEVILPDVSVPLAGNPSCERLDMSATLKEFPIEYCSLKEGLRRTIAWYQCNYANSI